MSSALTSSVILLSVALCFASAVFYVAGTAAMKLLGHLPFIVLMIPVGLTFVVAAWFEVAVLRHARLGQVFLLIFAFEVTLTALLALFFLNERYSLREVLGLATIIAGIVLLVSGSEARVPIGIPADVIRADETQATDPPILVLVEQAYIRHFGHLEDSDVKDIDAAAGGLDSLSDARERSGNPDGPA